jgi:hypothetical protein
MMLSIGTAELVGTGARTGVGGWRRACAAAWRQAPRLGSRPSVSTRCRSLLTRASGLASRSSPSELEVFAPHLSRLLAVTILRDFPHVVSAAE